jgi:hypothetical protein
MVALTLIPAGSSKRYDAGPKGYNGSTGQADTVYVPAGADPK